VTVDDLTEVNNVYSPNDQIFRFTVQPIGRLYLLREGLGEAADCWELVTTVCEDPFRVQGHLGIPELQRLLAGINWVSRDTQAVLVVPVVYRAAYLAAL
jgi:hypothetical protein